MSLTGSFTYTETTLDPTVSSSYELEWPSDLPEGDDNYAKRGTTETMWVSGSTQSTHTISGSYLSINFVSLPHIKTDNDSLYQINIDYNVYNSLADYQAQNVAYNTHEDIFGFDLTALTGSNDVIEYCYDYLKGLPGFELMENN